MSKEAAMIELTELQQQAIQTPSEVPPRVLNPSTRETFVLVQEELYKKMLAILQDDDPRLMEAMLAELSPEDWEDASNYESKP
jgi:hypothetical protein